MPSEVNSGDMFLSWKRFEDRKCLMLVAAGADKFKR